MRIARTTVACVAAAGLVVWAAACGGKTSSPATSSSAAPNASAPGTDYTKLLIQASDIKAPFPFTGSPPTNNPNGQPGAATTFSIEDGTRVIKDTIQVLADPDAAAAALNTAKAGQGNIIRSPRTEGAEVGTGGATLLGNSPDNAKGVTILLFTEGRALVTLEFDGPTDSLAPPEFVTDVGNKQDEAVKKGLGG